MILMRRGSDLSRPLTTPERSSRRHAPTPLTETESSRSINPPTVQKCLPQSRYHIWEGLFFCTAYLAFIGVKGILCETIRAPVFFRLFLRFHKER
ncbi:hypothetical protein CDAR_551501 [Caerostris darwini]|uniref:Uncharacterized protein n=1 Tax=Caerostris darwini TaxID=1538125 RepID=A0AAV4V6R3_9ARAC|nr:hypothetical protein CDAR_551501 [Caerostris darwini]